MTTITKDKVRVRFAPSPTGPQHIGGIRTALYNYLFAKKNDGKFILRIEDTDQERYVEGSEQYIMDSLNWLSIAPDEGISNIGEYGPYRQSERKNVYNKYIQELIKSGNAYFAFDTAEEIEDMRKSLKEAKVAAPQYNSISRMTMKNSLTLSEEEVQRRIKEGEKYVVRAKLPRKGTIKFHDEVRGWISIETSVIDDKVLIKSDGLPTYHFANIVDDHLMKISHVIRGEEWLPSTAIHVFLYQCFNWPIPIFCHLPLLLKPEGVGKLSKRAADQGGYPVFPLNWVDRRSGENIWVLKSWDTCLKLLLTFWPFWGGTPGNDKEIFSLQELVNIFSLKRINKSGVKFDIKKAQWFNQEYIKQKEDSELAAYLKERVKNTNIFSEEKLELICNILKSKLTFMKDLLAESDFFFHQPKLYDDKILNKHLSVESIGIIDEFIGNISNLKEFNSVTIKGLLHNIITKHNAKLGKILPLIRLAITGKGSGADLFEIIYILGIDEIIRRINVFKAKFENLEN